MEVSGLVQSEIRITRGVARVEADWIPQVTPLVMLIDTHHFGRHTNTQLVSVE